MRDTATPWAGTAANAAVVRNRTASDACALVDSIVQSTTNVFARSQAGALLPIDTLQRVVDRNRAQASACALADGFAYSVTEPALVTSGISMHIIPLGNGNLDSRYPRAYGDMLYIADGAAMSDGVVKTVWSASGLDKNLHIGHDLDGDIDSTYVYTPPVNQAPYWQDAPPALGYFSGTGGSYNFTPHAIDPDADTLTYSLVGTSYSGIYIGPSTGVLTITTYAAAAMRRLQIRIIDPAGLYADHYCDLTVQSGSAVKFTPGHYMTVYDWTGGGDTQAGRFAMYDAIANESCIKGVNLMLRWGWRTMEPSYGVYNLDWLAAELDYLHTRGKKLMFWPFFGRFNTYSDTWRATATPDYALNATYNYGIASINGGIGAVYRHWEPAVRARLDALCIAIGQRFDSHPAFEAFRPFCESSFNVDGMAAAAHESALRSAIATTLTAVKPSFPTTMLFSCVSWLNNLALLFPTLQSLGCGAGGTDMYPHPYGYPRAGGGTYTHNDTESDRVYLGEGDDSGNDSPSYVGVIPYWNDNQDPVYGFKEGCWLPNEIRLQGELLHCTHMTWTRMYDPGASITYSRSDMTLTQYRAAVQWSSGILPVLRANPTTWQTRPSVL